MTSHATPRIFLCHVREDEEPVKKLYHQLKEADYHPWLDKYDLLMGQDWWTEIEKIISDPHNLVVVCLSRQSIDKRGVVQREIARALDVLDDLPEDTIYLMPARLEACDVPSRLSHLQWVDLFEPDGFENLRRALDFEIAKRLAPLEPELIHIPAGEFLMGSDPKKDKDADDDEEPQHRLFLPEYCIARTPVTNAQYLAFVQAAGHGKPEHWKKGKPPKNKEDHPVVNVNWHDAMAYCRWLAETTGKGYRLPGEAEWEKAARGVDGRIWPWGDKPPDKNRCNFDLTVKDTTPVGQYSSQGDSPYGCVDMAGNVWEWTLSVDKGYPYDPEDGREDPEASGPRVMRGGAFDEYVRSVRCACRYGDDPSDWDGYSGFRMCVAAQ